MSKAEMLEELGAMHREVRSIAARDAELRLIAQRILLFLSHLVEALPEGDDGR